MRNIGKSHHDSTMDEVFSYTNEEDNEMMIKFKRIEKLYRNVLLVLLFVIAIYSGIFSWKAITEPLLL